jgi:hypothetical protein
MNMKKLLTGLSILLSVLTCFAQKTTGQNTPNSKISETNFPKVDFSYAFGTPHRITVGRPTNGNRTLLNLQPDSLRMIWNYADLTQSPLATFLRPMDYSVTWKVDIVPQIDGKPFATSRWTRLEGFLPALDNTYNDQKGSMQIEVIGVDKATLAKVTVDNTDNVPHQYRLLCNSSGVNNAWIDPGLWPADCLYPSGLDRADRALVLGIGADRWTVSADGRPATPGTLSFIWDLKPGEKRTAWLVRPYNAYETDLPALRSHDWSLEFELAKREWRDLDNRICKVSIPDQGVTNGLLACFNDLFIMREPVAEGYTAILPGTQVYRAAEPVEGSIAAIAIDQFGLHLESEESQRIWTDIQGANGDWADPQGWVARRWDISGFKSWAIMEHYKMTGDTEYLAKAYPHMLASSRFKEKQRARSRVMNGNERMLNYGLMPRGQGDSGIGDGDWFGVFIPHNIWAVYADKLSVEAAEILGKIEDLVELRKIYKTAYDDLIWTIEKGAITESDYRWIPGAAGKSSGSRWGVLNVLFPCHLLAPNHELVTGTLRYMEQNMSKGGVPLHLGFMVNGSWIGIVLDNVAEVHLARDEGDAASNYLYAALNHSTPLYTWCEERGQEPGTKETSGDLQHLWTPVAVVRVIRDILVMEDGDGLNLALGTDRSWLASGKPVGITDAPTHFGDVTYQIQFDQKKHTVTGEIKLVPKPNQPNAKWTNLHIRFPEGMKVKSVDKASKAKVLPDGEGIRWEGPVEDVKFRLIVGNK